MKHDDESKELDLRQDGRRDEPTAGEQAIERARRDLGVMADPEARVEPGRRRWPWSRRARAVQQAQDANLRAQLEVYLDDLNAIRAARQAVSRVAAFRAIEAAECAIHEIRSQGESLRHSILSRAHGQLTARFAAEMARLDALKDRVAPEMLDALRERALHELTESMKAASKARVEFDKQWLLKLKE